MDSRKPYMKHHSSPGAIGFRRRRSPGSHSPPPARRRPPPPQRRRSSSYSPPPHRRPYKRSRSRNRRFSSSRSRSNSSRRSYTPPPRRRSSPGAGGKGQRKGRSRSRSTSRGRHKLDSKGGASRPRPISKDSAKGSRDKGFRDASPGEKSSLGPGKGGSENTRRHKSFPDDDMGSYQENVGGWGDVDYRTLPPPRRNPSPHQRRHSPRRPSPRRPSPSRPAQRDRMSPSPRRGRSPPGSRPPRQNMPSQQPQQQPQQQQKQPQQPQQTVALKERFDQTNLRLTDRFLGISGPLPPFSQTENITIGIERSIPGDTEAIIPRVLSPAEVVVAHKRDGSLKPLYMRREFITPKEDVPEKRTIKMSATATPEPKHRQKITLTQRWAANDDDDDDDESMEPGPSRRRSPPAPRPKLSMSREDLDDFLLNAAPPSSSRGSGWDRDDRSSRYRDIDQDERVVLQKDEEKTKSPLDSMKFTVSLSSTDPDVRSTKVKSRFERDPNDLRHNLTKRKTRDSSPEKDDAFDARQKLLKKREGELKKKEAQLKRRADELEKKEKNVRGKGDDKDKEDLPDFSTRPGRFEQPNWDPDFTPKGIAYYEHDNRDSWPRGRYRGGYRGRWSRGLGSQRGRPDYNYRESSYRGGRGSRPPYDKNQRGNYRPRGHWRTSSDDKSKSLSPTQTWVHDKYQESETGQVTEEKPSSTTKN